MSQDEVEIHIIFDYVIQRAPTRTRREIASRGDHFEVQMKLARKNLDQYGRPDPRALWFAERTFLKGFNNKHNPDVRLLCWSAHLRDDTFVLSEYRVLLPASTD